MRTRVMAILVIVLALVLYATALSYAEGPVVGPQKCTIEWQQAPTNADGTPLTDLLGWRVYIGTAPGQYAINYTMVNASGKAPTAPQTVTFDCRPMQLPDGQKYAVVKTVDEALNESPASNEAPFVFDAKKASTATGLKIY